MERAVVARGTSGALLYVGAPRTISVYAYPGGSVQNTFNTPFTTHAMCSDAAGDVFVTATGAGKPGARTGYVYEYAHGSTAPVATLSLPANQIPVNCSSDPTGGNLAVTSYDIDTFAPLVEVYANAAGTPETFKSKTLGWKPQPAYDAAGNLFVTSGGNVGAELAKGKPSFQKITMNMTLGGVAHAQWDGKFFALESFGVSKHHGEKIFERIYRVQISGSTGTIVGIGRYSNWLAKDAGQSWIQGDTLLGTPGSSTTFWPYPAGGKAFKVLHHSRPTEAVTVSVAP